MSAGPETTDGPTVSRASVWFLRAITALTVLVVLAFLVDAVRG